MARYTNTWTPGVWEGVGPVLPTAASDAMSYYQQLLLMVKLINETRENCDKLADFVNDQLEEIVKYLNERIEDFNKSMNTFFEKVQSALDKFKADYEKFKSDMLAAFEQFKSDLLERQEEFERRIDEKIATLEGEWEDMKEEWETIKSEWASMKQEWQTFKAELLKAFEDFKAEMKRLWEEYKSQTNESLENWKEKTFNYFLGQYETIKQLLISQLPEVVQQYLPDALKQIVGIALKYNEETRKIDVNYGPGLAVDDQNRLIPVGDSGGGDSIEAGKGIDLTDNPESHKKVVSVKLAADGGLEFDDNGALKSTDGGSGGGDTIVAGEGIKVAGEGTKTVQSAPATSQTLGGVKTGDPLVTGLEVGEDGTISIHKWTAVDTTPDQEIFDEDMEDVMPNWDIDCKYQPQNLSKVLYVKLQQTTLTELGIPNKVQIINWTPDVEFSYNTTPLISNISTTGMIGQSNFKVTLSGITGNNQVRNGSGEIQFTWDGKENIIKVPFTIRRANMDLDEQTPIKIDGQGISSFGTYTFTSLSDKSISFVMKDGFELSDLDNITATSGTTSTSDIRIVSANSVAELYNPAQPVFRQKNIGDELVTLEIKPSVFGIQNNSSLSSYIQFYVKYNASVWDQFKIVASSEQYTIDNYSQGFSFQIQFPGYNGANFVITSDNPSLIGIGGYLVASKNIGVGSAVTIFAGRYGKASVNITTQYTQTFNKSLEFTVTETNDQPHFAVTTNSTLVGNTGLDIGNPHVDNSSYQFSKAQGLITFWVKSEPMNTLFAYIGAWSYPNLQLKLQNGTVIRNWRREGNDNSETVNDNVTYDFSNVDVEQQILIVYQGNNEIAGYSIVIGKVVD